MFRTGLSLRNISPMPQLPSSSGNRFLRALRLVEMTKRKSSVEMTEEGVPFDTSSFHQKGWPGRDFASAKSERRKGQGVRGYAPYYIREEMMESETKNRLSGMRTREEPTLSSKPSDRALQARLLSSRSFSTPSQVRSASIICSSRI